MIKDVVRPFVPKSLFPTARHVFRSWLRWRTQRLAPLTESAVVEILTGPLGIRPGDVVFVHSSTDFLQLEFSVFRLLPLLQSVVGDQGTLLFPTYPCLRSEEYIASGKTFDVRKSPSQMGLLTELARRHSQAQRSLYPTKSVCAIGPLAKELTQDHHLSPFGYGADSPFFKLTQHQGKIIGLGVPTSNLSFVHCVEDVLQQDFPRRVYQDREFLMRAIDRHGQEHEVLTYSHDPAQMNHNIPRYVAEHFTPEIGCDLQIRGMNFFRVDAASAFERMRETALQGFTIYGDLKGRQAA